MMILELLSTRTTTTGNHILMITIGNLIMLEVEIIMLN